MKIKTLFILSIFFLPIFISSAKLPEPDTIFYGNFLHNSSAPLTEAKVFQFQVESNGTIFDAYGFVIPDVITSRYSLKIPMDDGKEPRLPGTLKAGDTISRIIVKNITDSLSGTVDLSSAPLLIEVDRGSVREFSLVVPQNLSLSVATADLDLDGLPDEWEQQFALDPNSDDANQDIDGDGITNLDEFLTGTDPQNSDSVFGIKTITKNEADVTVEFGPVKAARRYTLLAADYPDAEDWSIVESFVSSADAPDATCQHEVGFAKQQYYQVKVDFE